MSAEKTFSLSKNNKIQKWDKVQNYQYQSNEILIKQISFIDINMNKIISNQLKSSMYIYTKHKILRFNQIEKNKKEDVIEIEEPQTYLLLKENSNEPKFNNCKIFLNEKSQRFMCLIITDNLLLFSSDISKNIPITIFETTEIKINILKMFLPDFSVEISFCYILLANNMLIQIQLSEDSSNNIIIFNLLEKSYNHKGKENEEYLITNVQYKRENTIKFQHLFYEFNVNQSNIISAFSFENNKNDKEKNKITTIKIFKNIYIAIAIETGVVYLVSISSTPHKIISSYKSNYGSISCISFSNDGNLLGIATQDNNAYIIDITSTNVISCLVGHKNYISNFIFELQDNNTQNLILKKGSLNNFNSSKIKLSVIDKDQLIEEWTNEHNSKTKNDLNLAQLYRTNSLINPLSNTLSKIYDIYTSGLDGYIGSFRVECNDTLVNSNVNLEKSNMLRKSITKSDKKDNSVKHSMKIEQYEAFEEYALIEGNEEHKMNYENNHYCFLTKVINEPIILMFKNQKIIYIVSKQNVIGNYITVSYFQTESDYNSSSSLNGLRILSSKEKNDKEQNKKRNYYPPETDSNINTLTMQMNMLRKKKGNFSIGVFFNNLAKINEIN